MKIEFCTPSDIESIRRLDGFVECSWSEQNIKEAFKNGITYFLKATLDGKVIGFVGFDVILDEISINNIAVDVAYRRRGVASQLLAYLLSFAEDNRKSRIFLEVNERNSSARALYEKAGYKFLSLRRDYYGKDKNAAVYVKEINGADC